jgi:hypothetical protein
MVDVGKVSRFLDRLGVDVRVGTFTADEKIRLAKMLDADMPPAEIQKAMGAIIVRHEGELRKLVFVRSPPEDSTRASSA